MLLISPPLPSGYLASKNVLPLSQKTTFKVAVWSCRAWAAYVVLSLVGIHRDAAALRASAGASSACARSIWA